MCGALFETRPSVAYRFNTQRGTWPASASMMSVSELRTHTRLSLIADVRCVRSGEGEAVRDRRGRREAREWRGAACGERHGREKAMAGRSAAAHLHEVGEPLPRVGEHLGHVVDRLHQRDRIRRLRE